MCACVCICACVCVWVIKKCDCVSDFFCWDSEFVQVFYSKSVSLCVKFFSKTLRSICCFNFHVTKFDLRKNFWLSKYSTVQSAPSKLPLQIKMASALDQTTLHPLVKNRASFWTCKHKKIFKWMGIAFFGSFSSLHWKLISTSGNNCTKRLWKNCIIPNFYLLDPHIQSLKLRTLHMSSNRRPYRIWRQIIISVNLNEHNGLIF